MIVLLELRQSSQGMGGLRIEPSSIWSRRHHQRHRCKFLFSWGSSLPSAEGEALGIIWKLEPKFEGSVDCHCLFRQEAAVESPDGW